MCSTPFGIIGIFTLRAPRSGHPRTHPVLNAFRHHWNLHPQDALASPLTFRRAQRLSASLESSRSTRRADGVRILSAQRLSASLESSRLRVCFSQGLNIRCSTPFGIIGIFTLLNRRSYLLSKQCSTPFGIIGIFTPRRLFSGTHAPAVLNAFRHHWNLHVLGNWRSNGRLNVLNAFRHHWNLHACFHRLVCLMHRCSTPFGIIGIFTSLRSVLTSPADGCSTPFGIIGIFTSIKGYLPARGNVLNAFRHHWNLHRAGLDAVDEALRQCSTPFGIIGIFTLSASN